MTQRRPPLYRFVADRSGQSNPLAVIFVVGFALTSAGFVVSQGNDAFDDTKGEATISLNEQSMSKLDSEASVVALGSSDTQTVPLGDTGQGTYEVRETGSWMRIEHRNFTGTGDNETIYNASLGAVVYESGDSTIAYEGGGVWRTDEPGNTVMVSPPEFRYRDGTLTLPAIRVSDGGDTAAAGTPSATIEQVESEERIYPVDDGPTPATDEPGAPYNVTDAEYDNPVRNGTVAITVHSPHYAGWADYFRERTEGNVSVDDANDEVTVVLRTAGGMVGTFTPPQPGNYMNVPSVQQGGHPVDEYKLWLEADNDNQAVAFNNRVWEMEYDSPEQTFVIRVKTLDTPNCNGATPDDDGKFRLTIYYDNGSTNKYQAWEGEYETEDSSSPIQVFCDGNADGYSDDGPVLQVNLTSTEGITYQEPAPANPADQPYNADGGDLRDTVEADEHGHDVTLNETAATTKPIDWVTNHYVEFLAPRFTLRTDVDPGANNANAGNNVGVEEPESQGVLRYDTGVGGSVIRFLHVTENEIEVRVAA